MGDSSGGTFDAWLRFIGHLHPLTVHFPIALILAAGLLELVSVWKPESAALRFAIGLNLGLGTLGAIVAATLGWIDASHIGFEADLKPVLVWHRWLGVAVTGASTATLAAWFLVAREGSRAGRWIYRVMLGLLCALLGVASHLGGLLVYGLDYFSS